MKNICIYIRGATSSRKDAPQEASSPLLACLQLGESPDYVELTSRNLSVLDAGDLVRCEVHDGQALSLESGSFDAVSSSFGIFLFPDRHAGWREAARVLKAGGLLACCAKGV